MRNSFIDSFAFVHNDVLFVIGFVEVPTRNFKFCDISNEPVLRLLPARDFFKIFLKFIMGKSKVH